MTTEYNSTCSADNQFCTAKDATKSATAKPKEISSTNCDFLPSFMRLCRRQTQYELNIKGQATCAPIVEKKSCQGTAACAPANLKTPSVLVYRECVSEALITLESQFLFQYARSYTNNRKTNSSGWQYSHLCRQKQRRTSQHEIAYNRAQLHLCRAIPVTFLIIKPNTSAKRCF